MKNFGQGSAAIADYTFELFQPLDPLLQKVIESENENGLPAIHVGPLDGRHLEVLSRALRPKFVVEIGVLAGYSAICIGRGMANGGTLYLLEKETKHAEIARKNLELFVATERPDLKFEIRTGPALENLEKLNVPESLDFVFIDADKPNYKNYWLWAVDRVRSGGVIVADNTFAWGEVHLHSAAEGRHAEMLKGLHALNALAAADPRVRSTIWPTAEGLTMSVKV